MLISLFKKLRKKQGGLKKKNLKSCSTEERKISIYNSDGKLSFAIIKTTVRFKHDWSRVGGVTKC